MESHLEQEPIANEHSDGLEPTSNGESQPLATAELEESESKPEEEAAVVSEHETGENSELDTKEEYEIEPNASDENKSNPAEGSVSGVAGVGESVSPSRIEPHETHSFPEKFSSTLNSSKHDVHKQFELLLKTLDKGGDAESRLEFREFLRKLLDEVHIKIDNYLRSDDAPAHRS